MSNGSRETRVATLGGGLSGLSAARSLIEMGYSVTLVEKRPFLGGRAFSFYSKENETEVDNGQHVYMGCCIYYIDFLRAIGAYDAAYLQDSLKAEVILDGRKGTLSSAPALGPFHMFPSFLSYPHLGAVDKILAAYGMLRARFVNRRKSIASLDSQTFYDWLKSNHQTEKTIENLWNLIILPTLNDDARHVNADMALMVIQEGLLKRPESAAIGYARTGLGTIADVHARRFIEESGGSIIASKTVRSLIFDGENVAGVRLADGSALEADAYVCALPYDALLRILPSEIASAPFFAPIENISAAPIITAHLWYDRKVMDEAFLAFLDSPIQWIFNHTHIQGEDDGAGQRLCVSLSGAWEFVDRSKNDLRRLFEDEMTRLFPLARVATLEKSLIIKHPKATFRPETGAATRRLSQATPISNLFLAGDWTDTGWPSTMEGAVRSGVYAALAVSERFPSFGFRGVLDTYGYSNLHKPSRTENTGFR